MEDDTSEETVRLVVAVRTIATAGALGPLIERAGGRVGDADPAVIVIDAPREPDISVSEPREPTAMVAIVEGHDAEAARTAYAAGATHWFSRDTEDEDVVEVLRFALRHARRLRRLTRERRAVEVRPAPAGDTRRSGRCRVSSAPSAHGLSADRLAADLHRALAEGEIELLFQPQVALASGAILGVEALARWEHPALGPLGAEELFAAADRAGLAADLSDHIHTLALTRAVAWEPPLDRLRLSINVTAADLVRAGFADTLLQTIRESGFARARLTLEIVESGLIGDLDAAAKLLARLRGAGCRIAIDDFGTGYSSLAYLKALPIDYLKIDRSLTRDITGSERDRVIVRGVIAMARSLGFETIVEGVETAEQRDLLAAEGCDAYQGFLCAPPLDEDDLRAIVGRHVRLADR